MSLDTDHKNFEDATDFLQHYGVLGMKWGVRKDKSGKKYGEPIAGTKRAKRNYKRPSDYGSRIRRDGKFKASTKADRRAKKEEWWVDRVNTDVYTDIYKKSSRKIRQGTRALNKKYRGENFRTDSAKRRQYYKEYEKMVEDQLNATAEIRGYSPSKRYKVTFKYDLKTMTRPEIHLKLSGTGKDRSSALKEARAIRSNVKNVGELPSSTAPKKLKHEEDLEEDIFVMTVELDEDGMIVDLVLPEDIEHDGLDFEDATDFLQHYGVLGMKWGVRKDRYGRKTGTPIAGTKRASQKNTAARRAARRAATTVKKATSSGAKKVGTFVKKTPASVSKFLETRKARKAVLKRVEQEARKKVQGDKVGKAKGHAPIALTDTGEMVEFLGIDNAKIGANMRVSRDAMATRSGKKLYEMSNQELAQFLERAQLEQKYADVVRKLNPPAPQPAPVSNNQNGSKKTRPKKDRILEKVGKHVAKEVMVSAATAVAKKHTQNFMDMKATEVMVKKYPGYKDFIKKPNEKSTKK